MRYDLAFFLCCCKSFLGDSGESESESFYDLLGVEKDASQDDIKRAYKKMSLKMHPDKLAQRGQTATEEDQTKFTRMKEAYEILSDQHKRETYDAIGERGMKWLEEPFSMDPQELAHNFANSSVVDRAKIFGIFVAVASAVLLLPVLICLHLDGAFGDNASWFATFIPLWIWNVFILFYHSRVILMGPITRPDHIPETEWVDPLPMSKRYLSLFRFILLSSFEVLAILKVDNALNMKWSTIFIPLYLWELTTFYKKWPIAQMRIVTVEDLESVLGKPFSEFTAEEKELIGERYSVVPSIDSPHYDAAQKLKAKAQYDMMKSAFRITVALFLLVKLDGYLGFLSWWIVFLPFWAVSFYVCYSSYQSFAEVQKMAADKDPGLFGLPNENNACTDYGAVGIDGAASPEALSEEEKEELKAQVMSSGSKLCSQCFTQAILLVLVGMFVAKLQGAEFSSLWIISPFLAAVSGFIFF